MADTPEHDSANAKPGRAKARHAPAIDLPATEVSDVTPEAPAEPQNTGESPEATTRTSASPAEVAMETPPPPQQGSRLAPALLGLVAGALGGLGAYQAGGLLFPKPPVADTALIARLGAIEQRIASAKPGEAMPVIPQALTDRLTKAEAQLAEAGTREAALRAELGKLGAALTAETEARSKAIAALGERPAAVGLTGGPAPAELETLKSRLGSVETSSKALPQSVAALGSKVEGLQPRLDSVSAEVQALSGRLAGLSARDALGAANARLAATVLLDEAFAKGAPLAGPLDLLRNLGADAGMLAAFAPFSATGVQDAKKLLEELKALKPAPAANAASGNPGFLERIRQGAAALIEVRRTGEITGTDDAAHLQRAEQALQRGEIGVALGLVGRLSAPAAPVYAGWRSRVEARLKAAEALAALRTEALGALAKAATPVK